MHRTTSGNDPGDPVRRPRPSAGTTVEPVAVIAVLDVGGTSIKSGVVRDGTAETGPSLPTLATADTETVLDRLAEAATVALDLGGATTEGLAIAFPGPFDLAAGTARIRGLHKFDSIHGVDLRTALRQRLPSVAAGIPVEFAHDNEAAGVGEAVHGAGRGAGRVLTITLGTGVGACLTDAGSVIRWIDGGHLGRLEVEKLARLDTPWGRADDVLSARGLSDRIGVPTLELRAAVDDPAHSDVVAEHGLRVGAFLASVVDALSPDLVVIGGGLVDAYDRFGDEIERALAPLPCVPAELGATGPLLGAADLAFPHLR
jgi:glucokinase